MKTGENKADTGTQLIRIHKTKWKNKHEQVVLKTRYKSILYCNLVVLEVTSVT